MVFFVLRDAGTFLKILCYGFKLNGAIKLKSLLVSLGANDDLFHPFLSFLVLCGAGTFRLVLGYKVYDFQQHELTLLFYLNIT